MTKLKCTELALVLECVLPLLARFLLTGGDGDAGAGTGTPALPTTGSPGIWSSPLVSALLLWSCL